MTGKARRDVNVVGFRMRVENKVLVRTIGEHAGFHRQRGTVRVRKIPADSLAQYGFIFGMNFPVDARRVYVFAPVVIFPDLESWNAILRASVESAFGSFQVEYREGSQLKPLGPQ